MPDGHQVARREVQADLEHQQGDADLGQFGGQLLAGGEARRERADDDARHQVADDIRQPQQPRRQRAGIGERQRGDDGCDDGGAMTHDDRGLGGWGGLQNNGGLLTGVSKPTL